MFIRLKNIFLSTAEKSGPRGFTTLEVCTALVILLLLALTISLTSYFVFFKTRSLRLENQIFNNTNFAMQIVAKDLQETIVTPRAAFMPKFVNESGQHDKLRFVAERDYMADELSGSNSFQRLIFSSLNSLKFENSYKNAPIQIVYYLDKHTDSDGGLILRRQTNRLPYPLAFVPKASDPIMIKDIQSIHFVYYDFSGNAFYDWDSENPYTGFSTPAMVEITVKAGVPERPIIFRTSVKLPCWRGPSAFLQQP